MIPRKGQAKLERVTLLVEQLASRPTVLLVRKPNRIGNQRKLEGRKIYQRYFSALYLSQKRIVELKVLIWRERNDFILLLLILIEYKLIRCIEKKRSVNRQRRE